MYMYTLSLILLKFEDVLDNFVFDIKGMRAGMKRRECSLFEFSAELEMVLKKGDVNTSLKDRTGKNGYPKYILCEEKEQLKRLCDSQKAIRVD